ncbi:YraN family protein [Methylobrevis pamukkalensis]|uniref:UPF0102 protein A6302_04358 n=1 Tax=Methylobrevis pamukkalensis TaxID=1439726 RepID=A0A1E3GUW9_9HYPH|nr:YraN family protein [Methylobrevis pamukkalensis]ODN67827.1 hypothetical protein A6302_04358 [Methylobrevis pamukkalensis]
MSRPATPPPALPPDERDRRQRAEDWGLAAERLVELAYRLKGWRCVARRWRSPAGEIDLVMRRGRQLAFVEVKARADLDVAAEAVTLRARRRIARAAIMFIGRHPALDGLDQRFDVALVRPWRWPVVVENAFFADD